MFFGIALLIFLVFVIKYAFIVVPEGYEYTVERLGKFMYVLAPGFHIITPFLDMVGSKVNMKEQTLNLPVVDVLTKDEVVLHIKGTMLFQIQDSVLATYQVRDLYQALLHLIEVNIRTQVSEKTKKEFLAQQESICYKLREVLDEATAPWGVKIIKIKVWDEALSPSDPFEKPDNYFAK
ncbi:MAG: SPFH domain-containing protein [Pseudomonadota bacterium]|nr:SPFH domain-containing protein [Pseudomonadota bacterium]